MIVTGYRAGKTMDSQAYILILLVCFIMLLCDGIEGASWNISVEEDLEFERQLKILNKPSIKSIFTVTGEIFDCVDFYKQPAFDHALLNNYTIEYEYNPRSLHTDKKNLLYIETKREECPIGSVPIKRMTKEDLIRERRALKVRNFTDNNRPTHGSTHYAIVRTKPGVKFVGAGSIGSVWTPKVRGEQYSAARLKIANGLDSIEAGWRVDPSLYGDNHSHLYIRTDAGKSHCFDSRCGFVVVDYDLAVGNLIFNPTSEPPGPIVELELFIIKDKDNGNWFLEYYQHDRKRIGFWPKSLFTYLAESGTVAEWGGEVFSPPGTPKPVMGSGFIRGYQDLYSNGYFGKLSLFDGQKYVKADKLDSIADSANYQVKDLGIRKDSYYDHLIFYGGSESPSV